MQDDAIQTARILLICNVPSNKDFGVVIQRKSGNSRQTAARRKVIRDIAETRRFFEHAYDVLDAAVMGAIIAGIPPASFEPVLSYWFMYSACDARGHSPAESSDFVSDSDDVFEMIIKAIIKFVDDYEFDESELTGDLDLVTLDENYGISDRVEQTELEEVRHERKAMQVMEWATSVLARDEELPAMLVEIAILVLWFKVAALNDSIDTEHYIRVKETVPLFFEVYNPIVTQYVNEAP